MGFLFFFFFLQIICSLQTPHWIHKLENNIKNKHLRSVSVCVLKKCSCVIFAKKPRTHVCFLRVEFSLCFLSARARFLSSSPATESFRAVDRVGRTWAARATISNNGCSPMRGREGKAKAWQRPTVLHSVHTHTHTQTHTRPVFFWEHKTGP